MTEKVRCANCCFWEKDPTKEQPKTGHTTGKCHRYAPQPAYVEAYWPKTTAFDWCGEALVKPDPTEPR
jgi:hypothetical protein